MVDTAVTALGITNQNPTDRSHKSGESGLVNDSPLIALNNAPIDVKPFSIYFVTQHKNDNNSDVLIMNLDKSA